MIALRSFFAAAIFAATVFANVAAGGGNASAQEIDDWKFRGNINWNHPDGRVIQGRYANSKVDDDRFSIIRSRTTGRWYIQFLYRDQARLLDRPSRFFIETSGGRDARRAYLEIDGRAWPGGGFDPGVVVSQLTSRDLNTLWRFSGNLVGVTYTSRKPGEGQARSRAYKFSGKQLRIALRQLGFRPGGGSTGLGSGGGTGLGTGLAPSLGNPPSQRRPAQAVLPARYAPFRVRFRACTRPPNISFLSTDNNARARRFLRLTRLYRVCRRNNAIDNRQALIRHVRNHGGRIRLEGNRWRYNGPIDCRCGSAYKDMIRRSIDRINAYVRTTNRRLARYDRVTRDRNNRVRRANRRNRQNF